MYSNKEIINGLLNNDRTIINKIYKTQYPIVANWIKKNSGSIDDCDDIFHEAFLIILRKLKNEELNLSSSFSTFLFAICKNLWLQELYIRSKYQIQDIEQISDLTDTSNNDKLEELKLKIYLNQLNLLEQKCRQIFLLCHEKKNLSEIMRIMGFSNIQAVADKKKNCKKTLIRNLLNCKECKNLQNEISLEN